MNLEELKKAFFRFHEDHPGMPLRDAAHRLDTTEAQLLTCFYGDGVTRLKNDWDRIFSFIPELGQIHIEVRTECGIFESDTHDLTFDAKTKCFHTDNLKLLIHPPNFTHVFLVNEAYADDTEEQSLQFFNQHGSALCKVFLRQDGSFKKLKDFSQSLIHEYQEEISVLPIPRERPDKDIDHIPDINDLFNYYLFLWKNQFTPTQAIRWMGEKKAKPCSIHQVDSMAEKLVSSKTDLEFWIENNGTFLYQKQTIQKAYPRGPWYYFQGQNLLVRIRHLALGSAFIVKNSLQFYDKMGDTILGLRPWP